MKFNAEFLSLCVLALASTVPAGAAERVSLKAFAESSSSIQRNSIVTPETDVVIPTFLAQSGMNTTFVLLNLASTEADFKLYFVNNDGNDIRVPISGTGKTNVVNIKIPARGSYTLETEDTPDLNAIEGWALLVHNGVSGTRGTIAGHAILRAGKLETVVPFASVNERTTLLPVDNRNGNETWASVVNFDTVGVKLTLTFYDENGVELFKDSLDMIGGERCSFNFGKPNVLTSGKRGVLKFESTGKLMSTFGFRFNTDKGYIAVPTASLADWQYY